MKYTVSNEADKKIQEDTDIIIKIVLKYWKPRAIVMFGGFGHEGGSFKKINSKLLPLNDYDLYLVNDKPISGEKLEEVGEECSKALGRGGIEIVEHFNEEYDENKFFHVDLHFITTDSLKKVMPTQRSFDLKTSLVVYGDKNILNQMPDIKVSKSDAIRLLFNKLDHFQIADGNSDIIKSIYAVKGFTDSASALLIFYNKYVSKYQDKVKEIQKLDVPEEYKKFVEIATKAKLENGYEVKEFDVDEFFEKSKKWVEYVFKRIIKEHLNIKSDNWKDICKIMYKKLPYVYFKDYLGSKYLFFMQYYLNLKFFLEAKRKGENLPKTLLTWKDPGLTLGISMMLYSFNEKKEAEKYLKKVTSNTRPLKDRLMKLYSIYYLQKLV
ncbi:MAG: hypothetical protein ABIH37_04000 [archaeon]